MTQVVKPILIVFFLGSFTSSLAQKFDLVSHLLYGVDTRSHKFEKIYGADQFLGGELWLGQYNNCI